MSGRLFSCVLAIIRPYSLMNVSFKISPFLRLVKTYGPHGSVIENQEEAALFRIGFASDLGAKRRI